MQNPDGCIEESFFFCSGIETFELTAILLRLTNSPQNFNGWEHHAGLLCSFLPCSDRPV